MASNFEGRVSSRFGPLGARIPSQAPPPWMHFVLMAAAAYSLAWGVWVMIDPTGLFRLTGTPIPADTGGWQCVGMLVATFGIGYGIASSDPLRHWPIVLVGLIGKVIGPLAFVGAAVTGALPWTFGATIITDDLVWWIPFFLIVRAALKRDVEFPALRRFYPFMKETILQMTRTHRGDRLLDLSETAPVLLVFLRHSGCTFCREALSDLEGVRARIEATGTRIVLVHMSDEESAESHCAVFGLNGVDLITDPDRTLYWAFGLGRGRFGQLFGPRVWWRGFVAGVFRRLGIGRLDGDGFQMPGAFLFSEGKVVRYFYHRSAADRPDYLGLIGPAPEIEDRKPTPAASA